MKKLTLGLGSLVAIAAPVSAVVACGSDSKTNKATIADKATAEALLTTSKDDVLSKLGLSPSTKFNETIYTDQMNTLKGRQVIGIVKENGNDFHGTRRVMYLLNGSTVSTTAQWGGATVAAVYGKSVADSKFFDSHKSSEVGAYLSFVYDSNDKLVKISTGVKTTADTSNGVHWANSNDIFFFEDKGALTVADITGKTFYEDISGRSIYGGVIWTSTSGTSAPSEINAGLSGKVIPTNLISGYHKTQYDNIFIKK